jgi:hypothetical protein
MYHENYHPCVTESYESDLRPFGNTAPTQEHFSVIDFPDIFKRTTQGITNGNVGKFFIKIDSRFPLKSTVCLFNAR